MTLTSKQRAYLRSLAMNIDPIFRIGKDGITPELCDGIRDALEARELIKVAVLKNCFDEPKELIQILSERTGSIPVQAIGRKLVLYKPNYKKPLIVLPPGK